MADDKKDVKKKSSSSSSGSPKPKPKSPGGGEDAGAGGPPMGMPAVGGGAPGMDPQMGAQPPMPGQGIDPYAALMGQVSEAPMSMPMGGGMGAMGTGQDGMTQPGGGMGGGMGMGLAGPGAMGMQSYGSPEQDIVTQALMSDIDPAKTNPELGQSALDPQMMGQEQMSLSKILEMLALAQGGIPGSGLTPPGRPGSLASGVAPNSGTYM